MRGNHLGSLSFCGEGGRVHLGRDTRRLIASRRRGWKATKTIRTVYRQESSACGEAARAMRGNHLGSRSYLHHPVLFPVGQGFHLIGGRFSDLREAVGG